MSKVVERFEAAVQALVGDGPIKDRLQEAYTEHLEDLQRVDLPISGNVEFGKLHSALHRMPAVGKIGCVRASVRKMSPVEAWWHSRTIVRLYVEVLAMERGVRAEAEAALLPESEEPPKFLARRS